MAMNQTWHPFIPSGLKSTRYYLFLEALSGSHSSLVE